SNASTILFVVSASLLMRGLPRGLIFCILPVSSSRFLHFPTVDAFVICCCIFNTILTNDLGLMYINIFSYIMLIVIAMYNNVLP
ncbi:hypothetical protein L9F63_003291, partial [Diploptera punctata]